MSKQERYTYWQDIITKQQRSGLGQEQFCQENHISFRKFKYYVYRLRNYFIKTSNETHKLTPIKIANQSEVNHSSNQHIQLSLPNGITCQIPSTIELATLTRFLTRVLAHD